MHSEMQQALHEHSSMSGGPAAPAGSVALESRPCSLLVVALPSPALPQLASPALPQLSRRSGEPSHFALPRLEASYYAPSCSQDAPSLGDTELSVGPAI